MLYKLNKVLHIVYNNVVMNNNSCNKINIVQKVVCQEYIMKTRHVLAINKFANIIFKMNNKIQYVLNNAQLVT